MFDGKYLEWNQKRIKGIVDYFGYPFIAHKKVLDLGCGHADLSGVLHRLGADVTAVDSRQEHLKMAAKKYPGIKTVKADLDRGWPFFGKAFDIILNLDLICHLGNYEDHLKAVCASTQHIILETAVCDSDDPYKSVIISENKNIYDLSANGIGIYPTAEAIERVLTDCGFSFKRQDTSKLNSGLFKYDWVAKNDGSTNYFNRRMWYCNRTVSQSQFTKTTHPEITPPCPPPIIGFVPTIKDTKVPVSQAYVLNPYLKAKHETKEVGKKIKTALCISGHLRTFESNFESVKTNILDRMDCDVFIHTWDIMGMAYRPCDSGLYSIETQRLAHKIQKLYNPKKLVIEPTKNFSITPLMQARLLDHRDISGILSMYYKVEACNNLKKEYEKEQNFVYDCVIRFRGDLFMETPMPVDATTNLNHLFIPVYGNFGGMCDQFAYGSSPIMDTYSGLYSNIQKYLEVGAPMHPEKILQFHADYSRLPIAKVHVRFLIKRANGLIQDNMLLERAWGFLR
jgi:2-polyprenyl-3-methyl-5-hydroxy-6-metoxy-1,4-benzoquinol methylase